MCVLGRRSKGEVCMSRIVSCELMQVGVDVKNLCMFFFFFQAEDGIRDTSVTGVQTCALPIYGWFQCFSV